MTNAGQFKELYRKQRAFFKSGQTKDIGYCRDALIKFQKNFTKREEEILEALHKDLRKNPVEAFLMEFSVIRAELDFAIKKIKKLRRSKMVLTPLAGFLGNSKIVPSPKGTILIIGPWNYPLNLSLVPLIGAIAAGNTVIIKTAGQTPHTQKIIDTLIKESFSEEHVCHLSVGAKAAKEFLFDVKYDHIFFTGSPKVGREIYKIAADTLTPVTLELGGKSPLIVDKDANIDSFIHRVVWGKLTNLGQTCIAPDYAIVHRDIKDQFVESFKKQIEKFYGKDPKESDSLSRIVSPQNVLRIKEYFNDGQVVCGGTFDESDCYVAPTIILNPSLDSPVMREEIFGPILPVLTFEEIEDIEKIVENNSNPLALYIFSKSKSFKKDFIKRIQFGGGCINDCLMHAGIESLPFGGIGSSGIGSYHGKKSFETFSHFKSVYQRFNPFEVKLRFPPYQKKTIKPLKLLV